MRGEWVIPYRGNLTCKTARSRMLNGIHELAVRWGQLCPAEVEIGEETMITKKQNWIVLIILFSLLLGACNLPGAQPTENPFPTFAAQTVEARLTAAVEDNPPPVLPEATDTPQPEPTPAPTGSPTNTAIPTQTDVPCDRAAFVSDVTIPDGTLLGPDDDFTKTWRLRNTGSCSWNASYDLIFKEGDAMGGPASQELTSGTVSPGQTVDISVDLTSPSSTGEYRGDWLIRSDDGIIFGVGTGADVAFYVEIKVGSPTATPYPVLASDGDLQLDQTNSVDLDTGTIGGSGTDLWFHAVSASIKYFESENGAKFKLMTESQPSLSDCQDASLGDVQILIGDISSGDVFCYKTNQGNYGRLEVEGITPSSPQTMTIDFKTWDT